MSQGKLNKAKPGLAVKSEAPNGQAHTARLDIAKNSKHREIDAIHAKIVERSTFLQCLDQEPPIIGKTMGQNPIWWSSSEHFIHASQHYCTEQRFLC